METQIGTRTQAVVMHVQPGSSPTEPEFTGLRLLKELDGIDTLMSCNVEHAIAPVVGDIVELEYVPKDEFLGRWKIISRVEFKHISPELQETIDLLFHPITQTTPLEKLVEMGYINNETDRQITNAGRAALLEEK